MIVLEFAAGGSLEEYLRKPRGALTLPEPLSVRFAAEIAAGMAFLHTMSIVHRDLAARNVLLSEGLDCKITDFGLARDNSDKTYVADIKKKHKMPWRSTSLEALEPPHRYEITSDVWSFAILLSEICSLGKVPYEGRRQYGFVEFLKEGGRMEKGAHWSEDLFAVMERCWVVVAAERPTFAELTEELQEKQKNLVPVDDPDEEYCMPTALTAQGMPPDNGDAYEAPTPQRMVSPAHAPASSREPHNKPGQSATMRRCKYVDLLLCLSVSAPSLSSLSTAHHHRRFPFALAASACLPQLACV